MSLRLENKRRKGQHWRCCKRLNYNCCRPPPNWPDYMSCRNTSYKRWKGTKNMHMRNKRLRDKKSNCKNCRKKNLLLLGIRKNYIPRWQYRSNTFLACKFELNFSDIGLTNRTADNCKSCRNFRWNNNHMKNNCRIDSRL